MATRRRAIFTVCSNNYVPMAKVLLESATRHHPEADIYLCLADEKLPDPVFYPGQQCEVVEAKMLGVPNFREFAFRYDIMEFNTALKPFMARHLLARGYESVVYLDPDIEVHAPLERVFSLLDEGAAFVLTPHITQPLEQPNFPNDLGIMRAGVYNLGFFGVGAGEDTDRILRWWSRRLQYECVNDQDRGIFMDQKFMDLVPGFTNGVRILRDTAYNVAYWNLQQRTLSGTPGNWKIDGEPLRFFHFSGFNPSEPGCLSKHTDLFRDGRQPPPLVELLSHYAAQVLANGHGRVPDAFYAYGRFASGTPLPEVVRRMFRECHAHWSGGDPFSTYEEYLHLPCARTHGTAPSGVTNLMAYLHERDPWLRSTYDLASSEGVSRYVDWHIGNGLSTLKDSRLIAPVALGAGESDPSFRLLQQEHAVDPRNAAHIGEHAAAPRVQSTKVQTALAGPTKDPEGLEETAATLRRCRLDLEDAREENRRLANAVTQMRGEMLALNRALDLTAQPLQAAHALHEEMNTLRAHAEELHTLRARAEDVSTLRAHAEQLAASVEAILASKSWRITRPLRTVAGVLRKRR